MPPTSIGKGKRPPVTPGTDMLEGFHAVGEAIAAGRRAVRRVLIADKDSSQRAARLAEAANRRNIPVEKVPDMG